MGVDEQGRVGVWRKIGSVRSIDRAWLEFGFRFGFRFRFGFGAKFVALKRFSLFKASFTFWLVEYWYWYWYGVFAIVRTNHSPWFVLFGCQCATYRNRCGTML